MYTYEFDNIIETINEGYFNQVMMGLDSRNRQDIITTFKTHKNEKYVRAIRTVKKTEDLEYLRRDNASGLTLFKKIYTRMKKIEQVGLCDETRKYYKGIKLYMDKGVTSKDVEATIKWWESTIPKEFSNKAKELREK